MVDTSAVEVGAAVAVRVFDAGSAVNPVDALEVLQEINKTWLFSMGELCCAKTAVTVLY